MLSNLPKKFFFNITVVLLPQSSQVIGTHNIRGVQTFCKMIKMCEGQHQDNKHFSVDGLCINDFILDSVGRWKCDDGLQLAPGSDFGHARTI